MSEPYHAYCVKCKTRRGIKNPRLEQHNGRVQARGVCEVCGCKMSFFIRG